MSAGEATYAVGEHGNVGTPAPVSMVQMAIADCLPNALKTQISTCVTNVLLLPTILIISTCCAQH